MSLTSRSADRGAWVTAVLAGLVLIADVATKAWAATRLSTDPITLLGGRLVLTESRNPGMAFGLGTSLTPLLALVAFGAVVAVAVAARRPHAASVSVALGLLGGGAAGNVVDRLFRAPGPLRGHVVDWIDAGAWPTFNLADSAITCAAVLMVVFVLLRGSHGGVAAERGRSSM